MEVGRPSLETPMRFPGKHFPNLVYSASQQLTQRSYICANIARRERRKERIRDATCNINLHVKRFILIFTFQQLIFRGIYLMNSNKFLKKTHPLFGQADRKRVIYNGQHVCDAIKPISIADFVEDDYSISFVYLVVLTTT